MTRLRLIIVIPVDAKFVNTWKMKKTFKEQVVSYVTSHRKPTRTNNLKLE